MNSQPDFDLSYLGEDGRGRRDKEVLRDGQEVPHLQRGLIVGEKKEIRVVVSP